MRSTARFAGAVRSRCFGSRSAPSTRQASDNGTLTVKMTRQPPAPMSSPPSGGADDDDGLVGDGERGQDTGRAVLPGALGLAPGEVHGGGVRGRRTESEQHPGGDQHAERRGEGAEQSGDTHQRRTDEVEAAGSVRVDQPPDDGLADGGREVERGDEPRRLRGRRPEGDSDRHQRHRDHRGVDRVEDGTEDHRGDQPPVEPGGGRARRPGGAGEFRYHGRVSVPAFTGGVSRCVHGRVSRSSTAIASTTVCRSASVQRSWKARASHSSRACRVPSTRSRPASVSVTS